MNSGLPNETEDDCDFTLVCQDNPKCTLNADQRKIAQENNCIRCSRIYVDAEGNAEAVEPYFEQCGDDDVK